MRAGSSDDRIHGVKRRGLLLGLGQHRVAEAGFAVNLARVPDRDRQGGRRARPDGNVGAASKVEDRPRVSGRRREADIADDSRDAKDLRSRSAQA